MLERKNPVKDFPDKKKIHFPTLLDYGLYSEQIFGKLNLWGQKLLRLFGMSIFDFLEISFYG